MTYESKVRMSSNFDLVRRHSSDPRRSLGLSLSNFPAQVVVCVSPVIKIDPSPKISTPTRSKYSGAGVLAFDEIHGELILAMDHTKTYRDWGGKRNKASQTCEEIAKDEACEETRGIFKIDISELKNSPYVDISAGRSYYRCYIVRVKDFSFRKFYQTDVSSMPASYRETTKMTRFSIGSIKKKLASNVHLSKFRRQETIGGRTMEVIRTAVASGLL